MPIRVNNFLTAVNLFQHIIRQTLAFLTILPLNTGMEHGKDTGSDITKAIAVKGGGDDKSAPPRIIAKGEGALAEKLLDIAFAEGVKVRRDKDLTELLDAFDVDSPIPLEALHAVSFILHRVYAENKAMAGEADNEGNASTPKERPNTVLDGATGKATKDTQGNGTPLNENDT